MVGHQHVGIEPYPAFPFRLSQALEKHLIVFLGQKDWLTIMATLDDMMGIGWKAESTLTGHVKRTRASCEAGTLLPSGHDHHRDCSLLRIS